jgi:hypothetical protein
MKKSVIAICIVFILFSFGAFLLFKSSEAPSNEAELIEKIQEGNINTNYFKELIETGNFDLQIIQKELKSISGVDTINFKSSNKIELICYMIENYSVEMIDSNSLIYVGENKEKEFDELGKYRFKIYINDSEASKNFKNNFKSGTVYNLPGNDDFKFIYTNLSETHATEIYIGSNTPFSVEKLVVREEEKLKAKITIPINMNTER